MPRREKRKDFPAALQEEPAASTPEKGPDIRRMKDGGIKLTLE